MADKIRLSSKQRKILTNSLAWCGKEYEPAKEEVTALFAWTDKGIPWPYGIGHDLFWGWRSHYGNPFSWIDAWEKGETNPPLIPPQVWIYDAYFSPQPSGWIGWIPILTDTLDEGPRCYPVFEKVMEILEQLGKRMFYENALKQLGKTWRIK